MVSAQLGSESSGPGSKDSQSCRVMFFGKKRFSDSASLPSNSYPFIHLGGNPAMD